MYIYIYIYIYIYTLPSPLYIKRPQMNAYVKYFDKDNKCINLLINDKKISEKSNEICNDYYSSLLKKEFDCELVYDDKYIKTKRTFYSDKVYTNFQNNNTIPKDNEYFACLSVILLDSIFVNSDKKYYPQIFFKKSKYAIKKKK